MYEIIYAIKWRLWRIKTSVFYKRVFGSIGKRSTICKPMYIQHPENIYMGEHVRVREFARLETEVEYNEQKFTPKIIIGDDVGFEQGLHMTCAEPIKIGNDVSIMAYVMITDIDHEYTNINENVINQKLITNPVEIGDGCFIGLGSRIMGGVKLGKHCVVGTNAVVMKGQYPDYCVLVGNPAKIIKKYDFNKLEWVRYVEK